MFGHSSNASTPSATAVSYEAAFLRDMLTMFDAAALQIRARGCLSQEDEEAITGYLVEALNEIRWDSAYQGRYDVHEDPRLNDGKRTGKRRCRVDILVVTHARRPRPEFHVEAKRLRSGKDLSAYLGPEGVCCLLDGRYAADQPQGAMLGYVQARDVETWRSDLRARIQEEAQRLNVDLGAGATTEPCPLRHIKYDRSAHLRGGQPFAVHHLLADCR